MIRRGEIYLVDLNPIRGQEQAGVRPALIIQNDIGNQYSSTTIVSAITSRSEKKRLPVHVELPGRATGLPKDSVVLLDQIRTIDKNRLLRLMGNVPEEIMEQVNTALRKSLALD